MREGRNQPASQNELHLLELLRDGNEDAFVSLIERYHTSMFRLAMIYVSERAVAEEVVQEAWMGVLEGLNRFEARASLKTWIFRILTNCAKTRACHEKRCVPFSSLAALEIDVDEPAVDPDRFLPADAPLPGHWASLPANWDSIPEQRLLSRETYACILSAMDALPPAQRLVIILHDVEGWTSAEICNVLGIPETNRRVLLHRARSKVRRALEQYFEEQES
ncbi:RNA polymerase sigma24 factor [Dictyobacter sp. S3.2.2.5]|uniref:RNA polymerase sigma24 factor n=1 Tax=Dictyobacter halimunensis TaxID=3026934 RepID=A0ABQ6FRS5_9CHLR|nr:RNA polymerase sigma24 factor [Dictyobacter sp. S3.2.2.5]